MKTNILYYILFAIMLVMTVSGQEQETDSSAELDEEDFDLHLEELEPDDADVRYLLRETNVEKALKREIRRTHDDYHHVDMGGAVGGIEVFCPERAMNNRNIKQLRKALRRVANKRGNRKNRNRNGDYHLIRLFRCQIYCPERICPN